MARNPTWTLGDKLTKARRQSGIDQTEVARELDISRAAISKWERDKARPRRPFLKELARIYDVDLVWLEKGEEPAGTGDGKNSDSWASRTPIATSAFAPSPYLPLLRPVPRRRRTDRAIAIAGPGSAQVHADVSRQAAA